MIYRVVNNQTVASAKNLMRKQADRYGDRSEVVYKTDG